MEAKCALFRFPLHPHERLRTPCGAILLKSVEFASGETYLYPRLTYCYLGLEMSVQSFLNRPDFCNSCEQWCARQVNDGVLRDVQDGRIWSEFLSYDGQPFLSKPGNFGLMMNMDFFQPYKHVQYSVGAIYLTILNLPHDIRNKEENVILVGWPNEPRDINTFLEPLVTDLLQLWTGVDFSIYSQNARKTIRSALLCVACDFSAGRKTCGFLSFNGLLGV